jgi:hypothetical protein
MTEGRGRRRRPRTVDQELRRGYAVADPIGSDPADPPRSAGLFRGETAPPDETVVGDSRNADRRARDAVRPRSEAPDPERAKAWEAGSQPWDLPVSEG